jgi:hypothetical protein
MYLRQLIEALEAANQSAVLRLGFKSPHSYRGFYEQLAFEPAENIQVSEMLAAAKDALGRTFEGWKGGDYKMHDYTDCWLAEMGCCGETIGAHFLRYMLADVV